MLPDLHPKLKELISQEDHGTILDGVFASSAIDTSGESLNVAGCDISSLSKDGQFNSEHLSPDDEQFRNASKDKPGFWSTLVGRIDFAKKIFKEEDCESKRELELWKKLKLPFIYGWGELFDAEGHRNAKDIAAIVEHYAKRGLPVATRFSIEGSTIKRDGNELVKTCARRVAITVKPANHSATSNLVALADDTKPYHQSLSKGEGPDSFVSCIEQNSMAFLAKKQLDPNMGYKFSHEHHDLGGGKLMTKVNVHTPTGEHIGAATFMHQGTNLVPGSVVVDDDHQRRGIGSGMYSHAEKLTGKKIIPSSNQTPEGAALWSGNKTNPQFGQLNKNVELEDLEKGIGGAIAGAMMAAAPMAAPKIAPPKPNIQHVQTQTQSQAPKWTPEGLHKDLYPIAFLESSFGKNTHHEPNSHGEYHSAIGAVGLKISSAHDTYKKSHALQAQFPDLQTPESFTQKIKSDPKFYNSVASQYWDTLKKRFKTPAKTAFAWRWGWGNAAKADDAKINADPYVQKFLHLTAEHYTGPKSKAVVEHPAGATHEPMAINTHDSMDKAETKNEKVPEDHVIGMEVPKGGSSCSKCKYVSEDGKKCGNEFFVKWNKGHVLPKPADKYCCDFFDAKEEQLKKMALIHDDHTNPVTVYRLQNKKGQGPYRVSYNLFPDPKEADRFMRDVPLPNGPGKRPAPNNDFESEEYKQISGGRNPNLLFGFEKPEHAEDWFGKEYLDSIKNFGFNVTPIKAKKIYRSTSGAQVMFEPHEGLEKTLTLGSSNAAPGTLTGGAALAKEGMVGKKKKDLKNQVLAAYRDWPMSGPFKEFLKSRLPEVDDKIIDKFAEMADDITINKLSKGETNPIAASKEVLHQFGSGVRAMEALHESDPEMTLHTTSGLIKVKDVQQVLSGWMPKEYEPHEKLITVFHSTDKDTANKFMKEGVIPQLKPTNLARMKYEAGDYATFAPGRGLSGGLYVGHQPDGVEGYGSHTLKIQVPESWLEVPPEQSTLGVTDPKIALTNRDGAVITRPIPSSAIQSHLPKQEKQSLTKTENIQLTDLKPPKGAVIYNNKYIVPGQVVLIGGPFEGSKLKLLALDDNYAYVQPFKAGDQEAVRVNKLNRSVEGTHFEILEVPQILNEKLPIYIHGQKHGDALNITGRQQELIHGIDLASSPVFDNHMNGSTEARTKGIIGWFSSGNGKVSYIKPSVMYEHDDLFGHPQEYLSTARREVIFHNLARDFFDLGEYVPVTACFKHPQTGTDHSACELIPNAAHVQMGSRDEIANDRLTHAGDSGVLDRLAIMDAIMGHADRHRLNYMTGPQNPNIFLIDNALIFNFSDHYIPSYLHDYYKFRGLDLTNQDLNQGAIEWLVSLDPFELGKDLEQNAVPKTVIEKCVGRLLSMQSVAIEGKTKAFDILFAHASYVNSFKPQSLEDIAEQEGLI